MKKIFVFYLSIFFLGAGVLIAANGPEELYKNGNSSYENEEYEKAISFYERLISLDKVSPEVFYNLGNSYFKLKKIGKAILNYERSLRLAPRDRDARLNLRLAKAMTVDKIDAPEKGFVLNAVLFLYDRMNIEEMTLACSFIYLAVILVLVFSLFFIAKRRAMLYTAFALGAIFFVAAIFLAAKVHSVNIVKAGIVVAEKTDARSGPKDDYLLQFTLHEGTEVRVVKESQGWYEIELSRDLKGWISKTSVGII